MLATSRIAVFFSMIRGSCCLNGSLVQAAGAEVAAEQSSEKWYAAVARSAFVSQNVQNTSWSGENGSCDPQKWHAGVARGAFSSQNVQNTAAPDPFLKLRSGKMARRCGAKHIFKSKCTKHLSAGRILAVLTRKNPKASNSP